MCLFTLVLVSAMSLSSCDWVRSRLGMPTSAQISQMRVERQKAEEEQQRLQEEQRQMEEQKLLAETKLPEVHRYHVIFGCFLVEDNAVRMMARLSNSGFTPMEMRFRNGFSAISAASYDDYAEAYRDMCRFLERVPYAPYDIWIYDLNQNLHGGNKGNYGSINEEYRLIVNDDYRMGSNYDHRKMTNEEYRQMLMNEEYRRMNEEYRKNNENKPVNNENNPVYDLPY